MYDKLVTIIVPMYNIEQYITKCIESFEKVNEKYFDQAEVMAKTSLLKLFEKTEDYMWGALIGVRPTKIVRRFLNMGISYDEIENI